MGRHHTTKIRGMTLEHQHMTVAGNARQIAEVCLPVHPLYMLRCETIADFYTEEPPSIQVKLEEESEYLIFEQISRVRLWIPNITTTSWMIYSEARDIRESHSGIVIRHVVWDREKEIQAHQSNIEQGVRTLTNLNPVIHSSCYYLTKEMAEPIIDLMTDLDTCLTRGFVLTDKAASHEEWVNYELVRSLDWGQFKLNWSGGKQHAQIEEYMKSLIDLCQTCVETSKSIHIHELVLDYSVPPKLYASIVDGTI